MKVSQTSMRKSLKELENKTTSVKFPGSVLSNVFFDIAGERVQAVDIAVGLWGKGPNHRH